MTRKSDGDASEADADPAVVAAHKAFAIRVRELRAKSQMSQGQLAKRAGMTQSYLSKLERQQRSVGLDGLIGLQRALQLASIEDLFGPPSVPVPTPTARIIADHPLPD